MGLTRLLVGEGTSSAQSAAAAEFAEAQLELLRIRAIRREMNEKIDLNRYDTQGLRKLAAIERYERLAYTRRRQASFKFNVRDGNEPDET